MGGHLNNTQIKSTRSNSNWAELSIEMKSSYKFTIACENEMFNGYTTEKLLTSFQAHSIPIYWGNPLVGKEFNSEAFINCHDYDEDSLLQRIIEIDNDDELFAKIVSAPWTTKVQEDEYQRNVKDYYDFINMVFCNQSLMRPIGTFADMYCGWFFNEQNRIVNKIRKIMR